MLSSLNLLHQTASRLYKLKIHCQISENKIMCCVSQWSTLGPLLLLVFFNDLQITVGNIVSCDLQHAHVPTFDDIFKKTHILLIIVLFNKFSSKLYMLSEMFVTHDAFRT